jgi:hypothetical protein
LGIAETFAIEDCGLHVPEKSMQATVTGSGKTPQAKKIEKTGHFAFGLPYNTTALTLPGMPKSCRLRTHESRRL